MADSLPNGYVAVLSDDFCAYVRTFLESEIDSITQNIVNFYNERVRACKIKKVNRNWRNLYFGEGVVEYTGRLMTKEDISIVWTSTEHVEQVVVTLSPEMNAVYKECLKTIRNEPTFGHWEECTWTGMIHEMFSSDRLGYKDLYLEYRNLKKVKNRQVFISSHLFKHCGFK